MRSFIDILDNTTDEDFRLIHKISGRAIRLMPASGLVSHRLEMDLETTHYDTPLDLVKLLNAAPLDFMRDISGINRNIDRKELRLSNSFIPLCAKENNETQLETA